MRYNRGCLHELPQMDMTRTVGCHTLAVRELDGIPDSWWLAEEGDSCSNRSAEFTERR